MTTPTAPEFSREALEATLAMLEREAEQQEARKSFTAFLQHVTIEERLVGADSAGGRRPFVVWPHLELAIAALLGHKLIAWLKARQIGASWLVAAYVVWRCSSQPNQLWVLISQGETEAKELLRKCRFVHDNLPTHIQETTKGGNLTEMEWANGSRILALPSTERAGRSFTASGVVMDEADFHPFFDANLAAVKPTIDAGGQLILVSTPDYESVVSPFKTICRAAPANGYNLLYFAWNVRPGRDKTWFQAGLAASPDAARFHKEYSATLEEALAAPQALRAFDTGSMDEMRLEPSRPVSVDGPVTVWQRRIVGRAYCAFTDTAHGVGGDYFVTCVMDAETGVIVADVFSNVIPPEEGADLSVKLLKAYNSPLWGVEDNEWGILTIRTAQALAYDNLYHRENDSDKPEGWHTDDHNRPLLWGQLQEAIKARHVHVWNADGLAQFYDVIRNPLKGGRIEAISGGHDDYPFAVGGCWQLRQHAHRGSGIMTVRTETGVY